MDKMELVGNTGKMENCAACGTSSNNKNIDCGHIIIFKTLHQCLLCRNCLTMSYCMVRTCKYNSRNRKGNLKFHKLPACYTKAKEWIDAADNPSIKESNFKFYRICSIHFEDKYIVRHPHEVLYGLTPPITFRCLTKEAIPTLHLPKSNDTTKRSETLQMAADIPDKAIYALPERDLKNELRKNWYEKINIPENRSCLKFQVKNYKDILNKSTDIPGSSTTEESNSFIASEMPEEIKIKVEEDELISSEIPEKVKIKVEYELISSEIPEEISNPIASVSSIDIPEEHLLEIGEEMHQITKSEMPDEIKIKMEEDELMLFDELKTEGECEEPESSDSGTDYEPDEENKKTRKDYISLDYKKMVVNLAKKYPKWTLKSLQRQGAHRLKNKRTLKKWEEQIKTGGTAVDKFYTIDSLTYDRVVEARKCNQPVTTKKLQQWAISAASQFPDLDFKASDRWASRFKRKYRLSQSKTTKLILEKETESG